MKYNDFNLDLEYSLEERENDLFDSFYSRVFPGLESIHFADDMETQKKGIDKILYFKSGYFVTVDEKKRRKDYGDILLELWSVWEKRKRGWLYTCKCDYIVYAVMPTKKVYLLPVLLLKKAWLKNRSAWVKEYEEIAAYNKGYVTKSIAIPTKILLEEISCQMKQELTV
ncbi:MAG: hypothetical protein PHW65_06065 [Dehalococcoidales bacterium]|nr:hypothetical protein [Dehalococcoidales bacterium]